LIPNKNFEIIELDPGARAKAMLVRGSKTLNAVKLAGLRKCFWDLGWQQQLGL